MFRTLTTTCALTLALTTAAHAEQYMLTDQNGQVIDAISYVGEYAGAAAFLSSNNRVAVFMEDYDPNYDSFIGVFSNGDDPTCPNGARQDPAGNWHESWGLVQIDFAPGHNEFQLQIAPCGNEADIRPGYGQLIAQ